MILNDVFNDVNNSRETITNKKSSDILYIKDNIELLSRYYVPSDLPQLKSVLNDENVIRIENKENILSKAHLDDLLQENHSLKSKLESAELKIAEMKAEAIQNLKDIQETKSESDQIKLCVEKINVDLEEQMNECFELHSKINQFTESEKDYHQSLLNMISETGKQVPNSNTVSELIGILKESLNEIDKDSQAISFKDDNCAMNDSILDLDLFQTETLCLKVDSNEIKSFDKSKSKMPKSKLPKFFTGNRKSCTDSDKSFTIRDSIHLLNSMDNSIDLSEELDKLDWEDNDKIESLVDKSFSILRQSILNCIGMANESAVNKLTKTIDEFCKILSTKVRSLQMKKIDLNSTCIFEKLEHEFEVETSIAELKEQLETILADKNNVYSELENVKEDNKNLNLALDKYKTMVGDIDECENSCSANSTQISLLQNELDSLSGKNIDIQNALNSSQEAVESYKSQLISCQSEIDKLTLDNNAYMVELRQMSNIKENLISLSEELKTAQEQLILSNISFRENKESIIDFEKKIANLLLQIDTDKTGYLETIKNKDNHINHLNNQLKNFESQDLLKESISVLKSENDNLLNQLNARTIDLENAVEDYLKIVDELEETKTNLSKNCGELHGTRNEINSSLEKQKNDIESLKAAYELHISELKINGEKLQKDCDILEVRLKTQESLILELSVNKMNHETNPSILSDLKIKFENTKIELETANANLESLRIQMTVDVNNLKNKIEAAENEIVECNKSIQDLMYKNVQLLSENDKLLLELESRNDLINSLKSELVEKNDSLTHVLELSNNENQEQTELFKNQILELETRVESLQSDLQKFKNLLLQKEEENKILKDGTDSFEIDYNAIKNEFNVLKHDYEINMKDFDALKITVECKDRKLIELTDELNNMYEKLNVVNEVDHLLKVDIENINMELQKERCKCGDEIDLLKTELIYKENIITEALNDCQRLNIELIDLKQQLALKEKEIFDDQRSFETIKMRMMETESELQTKVNHSASTIVSLQNNLLTCEGLLKEQEDDINITKEANFILERDLNTIQNKFTNLKLEFKLKEQELDKLNLTNETIYDERNKMKEKQQLLEQAIRKVNENSQEEKFKYQDKIETLKNEIEKLELQLAQSVTVSESSVVDALRNEIEKLKFDCNEKVKQIEKYGESLKSFDTLLNHYNELKTRYRNKRAQFEKMEDMIKQLQADNERLKKNHNREDLSKYEPDNSSFRRKDSK